MAIQKIINAILYGLSTDTKPTTFAINTLFYETNTGRLYIYTSTGWKIFNAGQDFNTYKRSGATTTRWYVGGQANGTALSGATALTANTIYATPVIIGKHCTINGLGVSVVTSVASSAVRLGIYTDNNTYPDALIAETAAPITTTSANSFQSGTFTTDPVLAPGLYWLVLNSTTAASNIRHIPVAGAFPILGVENTATQTAAGLGWSIARTYAALPNPFTSNATVMITAIPAIYVRVSV